MSSMRLFGNARIHTMDPANPTAEAMLVEGDRIVAVGARNDLDEAATVGTERVDLNGRTVIPGFNDSHGHILWLGMSLDAVDVSVDAVDSITRIVEQVAESARRKPQGTWIVGRGYDQNMLLDRRHPTREDLDSVAPHHPVVLRHTSGHVLTCNSAALAAAGVTPSTADPQGGAIDRDRGGAPTGVMKESAMDLVTAQIPPPTVEEGAAAIVRATETLSAHGITSVSDAATGQVPRAEPAFDMYRRAFESGGLRSRIQLMPHIHYVTDPEGPGARPPAEFGLEADDRWLHVGPVKIFSDGALSTQTAAMRAGYVGQPENRGILLWMAEQLRGMIQRAHAAGWQIATHALGDRAVEAVVDAYEAALRQSPRADHRHRIEHCMVADQHLCERIARLGIIPSMQPDIFRLGDGYVTALGVERASATIPVATLQRLGARVAFSSDFPVIPCDPLQIIRSSVERTTPSGVRLGTRESTTIADALRYYTRGGAFATRTETDRGMLAPGYLADFAVLSDDPLRLPLEEWDDLHVVSTFVGGTAVFSA
jgi:predicted amidohydrolase YtcJ